MLTLAINDVWAYKVILKKYSKTGNDYNATYEITLWDHFGLDLPDITEHPQLVLVANED